MEKFFRDFPRYGKISSTPWKKQSGFSTPWKKIIRIFHAMEKMPVLLQQDFPRHGKSASRESPR
ncbi:MAG TPA: hypothetical protein P5306_05845, partial [Kiritimatiellia bacterium]|nr:hypothetical protein [Kiritimatiellia bacterium]